jgi:hypothetical protein
MQSGKISKEGYSTKRAILLMMMMVIVGRVPFSEQPFRKYEANRSVTSGIAYLRSFSK